MVLVISRFRVANGMDAEVARAFAQRPRLVDEVPGFLGLEVFTEKEDPAIFHLATRWVDEASFEAWHGGEAHRASHAFIPRGLKVDAQFTRVVRLGRLPAEGPSAALGDAVADAVPFVARVLSKSRALHFIEADSRGVIRVASAAVHDRLGAGGAGVEGRAIWDLLVPGDAEQLRARVAEGSRCDESFLLNFVGTSNEPYTAISWLNARPAGFVVWGEPDVDRERTLQDRLIELNNQLAVLSRENERRAVALAESEAALRQALDDLRQSHWLIRRVQEVLPICMACGKVRPTESSWVDVVEFLKGNTRFLSHGYCPDCARVLQDELTREPPR